MEKKKIFVVEDESIVSLEIQSRLKSLGYAISGAAASGDEAIRKVIDLKPDLILMDIRIKGDMDGIETAAEIKKIYDIPIIFLTAYADPVTIQRAKITDPFGYIIKPFEERELHISIEIALYKDHSQKLLREKDKWLSTILRSVGDAVIATDWSWGSFSFGKDFHEWGYAESGLLVLSQKPPSYGFIRLDIKPVDWFRFNLSLIHI